MMLFVPEEHTHRRLRLLCDAQLPILHSKKKKERSLSLFLQKKKSVHYYGACLKWWLRDLLILMSSYNNLTRWPAAPQKKQILKSMVHTYTKSFVTIINICSATMNFNSPLLFVGRVCVCVGRELWETNLASRAHKAQFVVLLQDKLSAMTNTKMNINVLVWGSERHHSEEDSTEKAAAAARQKKVEINEKRIVHMKCALVAWCKKKYYCYSIYMKK